MQPERSMPHSQAPTSADAPQPLTPAELLQLPVAWRLSTGTEHEYRVACDIRQVNLLLSAIDKPPTQPDDNALRLSNSDLVELAIQTWRLEKRVQSMDPTVDARAFKQFTDSVRRFTKLLERFSTAYEDVTNKPFTSGWQEVEVVNWDEPDATPAPVAAGPWVKQTISPIVRRQGIVIKTGQVICVDMPDL